jgi:hypothetical protein
MSAFAVSSKTPLMPYSCVVHATRSAAKGFALARVHCAIGDWYSSERSVPQLAGALP